MDALALTTADIRPISGEPRVQDLRLGEVLGFERPRRIRRLITKNRCELEGYGEVSHHVGTKPGAASAGGRPEACYHLNEAQALLVCMFARTNEARVARKQIIEVFLAYRHGKLVPAKRTEPANDRDKPWAKMSQRNSRLRDASSIQDLVDSEKFARAIAYVPSILFLDHPDGRRRKQTRPRWWYDREVREAVIALHRQSTIGIAVESLKAEFGKGRSPSRSSLARFWLVLDDVRAAS